MWGWLTSVITAFEILRREDRHEVEAILGYKASSRPTGQNVTPPQQQWYCLDSTLKCLTMVTLSSTVRRSFSPDRDWNGSTLRALCFFNGFFVWGRGVLQRWQWAWWKVPITVLDRIHPNKHSHRGRSPKVGAERRKVPWKVIWWAKAGHYTCRVALAEQCPGFCHLLHLCLGTWRERGERGERKLFRRT